MRLNTGLLETTFMILVMQIKAFETFGQVGQLGVHPTEQYGALRTSSMHMAECSKVMQIL
jgi:hypothetical protein